MSDIRYQERDDDSVSNVSLLANALVSDMQTDEERQLLREYHCILKEIETDQEYLGKTKAFLLKTENTTSTPLAFESEVEAIKKMAKKDSETLTRKINANFNKLFALEASPALKRVLERERVKADERFLQDGLKLIEEERARKEKEYAEILEQRRASRQAAEKQYEAQRKEEQQKTSSTKEVQEQDYTKRMLWLLMPMVLSITVPLLMLDTPIWLMSLIDLVILSPMLLWSQKLSVIVPYAYHIIRPILYISALVVTILGVQDFLAIAFYILMAIQIPRMIKNFIGTILIIYYAIPVDKE